MKKITLLTIVCLLLIGCQIKPRPIEYGEDNCYYCSMTIVEKTHGAEVVTVKGKIYKFDAIECMINFNNEFNQDNIKFYLTNDYLNPGELIDATQASYIISKEIPSPMGAFLSAVKSPEAANNLKDLKGGDIYSWNAILKHFHKK